MCEFNQHYSKMSKTNFNEDFSCRKDKITLLDNYKINLCSEEDVNKF